MIKEMKFFVFFSELGHQKFTQKLIYQLLKHRNEVVF